MYDKSDNDTDSVNPQEGEDHKEGMTTYQPASLHPESTSTAVSFVTKNASARNLPIAADHCPHSPDLERGTTNHLSTKLIATATAQQWEMKRNDAPLSSARLHTQ